MMGSAHEPWRIVSGGIVLRVRLTPKASRDVVEGSEETADGTALKARVRAVPADGAANSALERLIADWLGIPKGTVNLIAGGKSRIKSLSLAGDGPALARLLGDRLAGLAASKERNRA